MLMHSVADMDALIVARLPEIRRLPFDVVVHLPRSGTIPASLLATHMRKAFASVDEFCAGMVNTRKADFERLDRILVVDDSIRTGEQMAAAVARIRAAQPKTDIKILAVYGTKYAPRHIEADLILLEHDDVDYIYPWFLWKTKKISLAGFDMDGVLCRDCLPGEDDDGPAYRAFLENADLKFFTPHKMGAIITSRLEKYRPETEAWLKRHGFEYKRLIMGPWETLADRKGNAARWKAGVYVRIGIKLYVESSLKEAEEIAHRSGKKVWCIETQRIY